MTHTNGELLGIAGSGTIACGLAATASSIGEVRLLARSCASAERAKKSIEKLCCKLEGSESARVEVVTDEDRLGAATVVVEAIVEEESPKRELLAHLNQLLPDTALVASTTSSLNVARLAEASGRPDRFFALHVFNPVPRMNLVEVCFPTEASPRVRERALGLCAALGKTAVVVPDAAGFVVNRLLFPFLFDAVRMLERTGMDPEEIDTCMKLGAGHPMGPLALLDYVGLDVADSIGEALYADSGEAHDRPPGRIKELVGDNRLGKKTGAGFYSY